MANRINDAIRAFEQACQQQASNGGAKCSFSCIEFLAQNFPSEQKEANELAEEFYTRVQKMGFPEVGRLNRNGGHSIVFATWQLNPQKVNSRGSHAEMIRRLCHMTANSEVFNRTMQDVERAAAKAGEPLTLEFLGYRGDFSLQDYLRQTYPDQGVSFEGVWAACQASIRERGGATDQHIFPTEALTSYNTQKEMDPDSEFRINTISVNKYGNTMRIHENHHLGGRKFDIVNEPENTYAHAAARRIEGASDFDSRRMATDNYASNYTSYPDHPYMTMASQNNFQTGVSRGAPNQSANPYATQNENPYHTQGRYQSSSPYQTGGPYQTQTRGIQLGEPNKMAGPFQATEISRGGADGQELGNRPRGFHTSAFATQREAPMGGAYQSYHSHGMYGNRYSNLTTESKKSVDCSLGSWFH